MEIALIAMSGVRACDEELMKLGLTLPGFVERSRVIASLPSLGLLTLAGMTPKHHRVSYFEVRDLEEADAIENNFDLVAISTFTAQAMEACRLAARLRGAGTAVVMGGLHVTAVPEDVADYVDAVVIGEGEVTWQALLDDVERGDLKPVYDGRGQEFDLAQAPMPAYELLEIDRYNRLTVQVTRGCPMRCEFCASSILLTDRYKHKPADKVLAEIDRIRELWPRPFIEFADDNSFCNRRYWKNLLPKLADRSVRWFTETDVSVGEDDDLLAMMRQAGCVEVLVGLESPDATGLDGLELRTNWKQRRAADYLPLVRNIQSHGIRVNGCFIVGLDGHDEKIFDRIYDFVEQAELFDVQITLPTPFPGTPFYERLRAEDRLIHEQAWDRSTLFDVNFQPTRMSVEQLRQGFIALGQRLYSDSFTKWRHDQFNQHLQRNTKRKAQVQK